MTNRDSGNEDREPGHLASALGWTLLGRVGRVGFQIAFIVVLAKILEPHVFGAAAIVLIAHRIVASLTSEVFSQWLVRANEWNERTTWTTFTLNLVFCISLAAIILLVGIWESRFLALEGMAGPQALVALGAIAAAPAVLAQARLARDMQFRKLAKAETISTAAAVGVGVAVAVFGGGIWAVGAFSLTMRITETFALGLAAPLFPNSRPRIEAVAPMLQFATPLAGFHLLAVLSGTIDEVIVARALGAEALGSYAFAKQILVRPAMNLAQVLQRVYLPIFARLRRDPARFAGGVAEAVRVASLVGAPLSVLAGLMIAQIVELMFGSRYLTAAPLMYVFGVMAAAVVVGAILNPALRAEGRSDLQALFAAARLIVLSLGLSAIAALGGNEMAIALFQTGLTVLLLLLPVLAVTILTPITFYSLSTAALPGLALSITTAIVTLAAIQFVFLQWPTPARAIAVAMLYSAAYALSVSLVAPTAMSSAVRVVRKLIG